MAFRSIGTLAGDVLAKVEKRAGAIPAKIEAADQSGVDGQPPARPFGGKAAHMLSREGAASNGNGKKAGAGKAPASQQGGQTPSTMPGSKVIAPPTSRFPRRSAIIFDLDMERRARHQARSLSRTGALDLRPLAR